MARSGDQVMVPMPKHNHEPYSPLFCAPPAAWHHTHQANLGFNHTLHTPTFISLKVQFQFLHDYDEMHFELPIAYFNVLPTILTNHEQIRWHVNPARIRLCNPGASLDDKQELVTTRTDILGLIPGTSDWPFVSEEVVSGPHSPILLRSTASR